MKTILTVIGARPQIIKAAAISRAIASVFPHQLREIIVHTGQHYDENMSGVFFKELGIPHPTHNLEVGSGHHGQQTAKMIAGIEALLLEHRPDVVLVYGDTNSTLAAAIAAAKLHIPLVHVEAGLRSFNKKMPEELNRIMCDHSSTLLFSPTTQGVENLQKEGFAINNKGPYTMDNPKVYHCGDVMYDNALFFAKKAVRTPRIDSPFALVTIHRDNNTDDPQRIQAILRALLRITEEHGLQLAWPIHPRTRKMLESNEHSVFMNAVLDHPNIHLLEPQSFLEMIALESHCRIVVTDSGGVQKEAFFFQKPCVILRPQTEWVELIQNGNALLADADEEIIVNSTRQLMQKSDFSWPSFFGDGKAAEFICGEILHHL